MTQKMIPVVVVNTHISVFTNLHQMVKNVPGEGMRNWEDGLLMGISYQKNHSSILEWVILCCNKNKVKPMVSDRQTLHAS